MTPAIAEAGKNIKNAVESVNEIRIAKKELAYANHNKES